MNWAYIAGFFDGEGSITRHTKGYRITIAQTNFEVLEKIRKFASAGSIIEPKKRKKHWKDSWVYYIASQRQICDFLNKILIYLIVKKEKVELALPVIEFLVARQLLREKTRTDRIKHIKSLRIKGLTYRAIGKELRIDWGYARRLSLKD
ncbi:MAG: LAGLIDADG family homing endonuclease [Patescibacteria group bacterium]